MEVGSEKGDGDGAGWNGVVGDPLVIWYLTVLPCKILYILL